MQVRNVEFKGDFLTWQGYVNGQWVEREIKIGEAHALYDFIQRCHSAEGFYLIAQIHEYQKENKILNEEIFELNKIIMEIDGVMKQKAQNIRELEHRIFGLREAIGRWRVKAGVDEPPEFVKISGERTSMRAKNEWMYYEHYLIPVHKNPDLARDAWAWLEQNVDLNNNILKRIYYHEKHQAWAAVFLRQW